jgi:hypothetical protein
MFGVTIVFGGSLLIAGTMISPDGLHIRGLVLYAAIMLVLMPFAAWQIFATQLVLPTAGPTRIRAVINTWVGGTLTAVCAIFFIASVLSYPSPGAKIEPSGHLLIPFMPRFGLALGLFCLCEFVACGVIGAIAPILRREVAIRSALIGGIVLFGLLYGAGWYLVIS